MAVELTPEQIEEWARLAQQYNDIRVWSNKDATAEEVAEIKTKFDEMGKGEQSDERKQKQMETITMLFEQIDTDNTGKIDREGHKKFYELLNTQVMDVYFKGHFEVEDKDFMKDYGTFLLGIFGDAEGNITKDGIKA